MVKEGNQRHVRVRAEGVGVGGVLEERLRRDETRGEVVEARGAEELAMHARDACWLDVVKRALKVEDVDRRHSELLGEHRDQQGLLPIPPPMHAVVGARCLALTLALVIRDVCRLTSEGFECLGGQNGLQVILLVHLLAWVHAPRAGQDARCMPRGKHMEWSAWCGVHRTGPATSPGSP